MILIESLLIALSTYSVFPVPQFDWNERNMKYSICFLPVVGILCCTALWAWYTLCLAFNITAGLFCAIATVIPLLVTGGIHMDGYIDTVDALASHQSRERKLEILKDPHCGAFALVYLGVYLLVQTGLLYELYQLRAVLIFCPVFILSRSLSALCAVTLPSARSSGMLCSYTQNAKKKRVFISMCIVSFFMSIIIIHLRPLSGFCILICGICFLVWYQHMVQKQFGGVTGDTSGFFLQMFELFALLGALIGEKLT